MKKQTISFGIRGEFIELTQLLKALNLADSGGHAKLLIDQGLVKVNQVPENRKRAKLRPGDQVTFMNYTILLT